MRRRHLALLTFLWLHATAVALYGVARGYGVAHSLVEGGVVAVWAAASTLVGSRRRAGPALVALGLLTASAVIVHLSGGVIEAHLHFFVVIVLLAVCEDWMIFLLATAFASCTTVSWAGRRGRSAPARAPDPEPRLERAEVHRRRAPGRARERA